MTDWLRSELTALRPADAVASAAVRERAAQVLRPPGALARLDELAEWVAAWQGTSYPRVDRPHCLVFGGDHGIAAAGVSAYPADVTVAMQAAIQQGKATITALGAALAVPVTLVDVGIARPTGDIRQVDALDHDRCGAIAERAAAAVDDLDTDLLVIGELGIGNTTVAAAVCACLYDEPADRWVGRGTGVDDDGLQRKLAAVEQTRQRVVPSQPLDVLRRAGGSELLAMAAATLAARRRGIPVVVDGFVATAALAPLQVAVPGALDHCLVGHASAEPGHRRLLERLGKRPLLDLDMRLGEASGAMLAVPLVRAACAGVTDVATFGEWFG
jgi:nicotinate-nucleotide--dimethylbenzimidazole phosphoribosyltransferase